MSAGASYIENERTKERMQLKKEKGVYVFEVQCSANGKTDSITLDSGAGVGVWPIEMLPKAPGIKMIAANGTEIENHGQKIIKFRGIFGGVGEGVDQQGFRRRT